MKKTYNGLVLFILIMVILLYGNGFLYNPTEKIEKLWKNIYKLSVGDRSFETMKENLTWNYCGEIKYQYELLDLNSLYLKNSGFDYITKNDSETIIKLSNGQLSTLSSFLSEDVLDCSVSVINKLYKFTKINCIDFLYIACPSKDYYFSYPEGFDNFTPINLNRFYKKLDAYDIPYLNLTYKLIEDGREKNAFYNTDHHWKVETGFWATEKILQNLKNLYDYDYNEQYTNLLNYNLKVYDKWFLGSLGKKTGMYFTEAGVDDFTLITPNFETSFEEELPLKQEKKEGNFIDALLAIDKIEKKDYYEKSPYHTYTGGDYRFQIIHNNNSENKRKILLIRDSFACPVVPFLAMQNEYVYIYDSRDFIPEEKINLYNLIEEVNPDCILMLFNGVPSNGPGSSLDFE